MDFHQTWYVHWCRFGIANGQVLLNFDRVICPPHDSCSVLRFHLWYDFLHFYSFLTLVLLNKLRCLAHFQFSANQNTQSRLLMQIHIFHDKQCRSRSVGFFFRSQLIWIYNVCIWGRAHPGSAGLQLKPVYIFQLTVLIYFIKNKFHVWSTLKHFGLYQLSGTNKFTLKMPTDRLEQTVQIPHQIFWSGSALNAMHIAVTIQTHHHHSFR